MRAADTDWAGIVRAELLQRGGQAEAARQAYLEALDACPNGAERDHIRTRLALVSRT